ncbi:MAG TPA: PDZ domain-containing protein [Lacipirellulaceae bacterium]|nr:PDZ domain-containing protein [Lacipirellulaceae bacterium]
MRKVTYVGLCWTMILGLVAAALGQQSNANGQAAPQRYDSTGQLGSQTPPTGATQAQPNAMNQPGNVNQPLAMPAPVTTQKRSMMRGQQQPGTAATPNGQQRGALGVWLVESGGPGVEIQRITPGSAAQQAGLRSGDFILQVNGRGVDSPEDAAQMVRRIPVGQSGELTIWRNGNEQRVHFTMQPAPRMMAGEMAPGMGEEMEQPMSHEVGFGGSDSTVADLVSRTSHLEQQLASLTQELQQLRQDMTQMRTESGSQTPGLNSGATPGGMPENATKPNATPGANSNVTPPAPGFGQPETKTATPATPPATDKSAAPGATNSNNNELFGTPASQPKKEAPKPENKNGTNDLFK